MKINKPGYYFRLTLHSAIFSLLLYFSPSPALSEVAGIAPDTAALQSSGTDTRSIQGYLSGKFVSRTSRVSDEKIRDDDIFTNLRLDISGLRSGKSEFHFFGTFRDDLANNRDRTTFSPFEDIGDTYRSRAHGYLYEAHLDLNRPVSGINQLRIGRQDGAREEPIFFDGIAADFGLAQKLAMTVYGGAAVHFYELGDHWGDDTLAGAGLDYLPLAGTVISTDYLYVTDKRNLVGTATQHDHLVSLKLSQRFSPNLKTSARIRYLNDDPRDLKLRAIAALPSADLEMNVTYIRQFRTQNELSNELSPFFDVLGQSFPYQSYDIKLRKLFGRHFAADLGYFQRSLVHADEENAFNRAFRRTFAVVEVIDPFVDRLTLSLTGEQWKSGQRRVNSTGLDASYAFKSGRRSPKLSAGSYYSLFKYDYYVLLGERTNVRTYYGKIDYPFGRQFAANGSYEFEHGLEDYKTAKLGIRYDF